MNDYFCVLPFYGYEYSTTGGTHCCLLPKDYNIDSIRKDILEKNRSSFCNACWKLEDAGLISDRKLKNSALDFYWDRDIRFIEDEVRQGKYSTIMVKNITSNTCNSTCVTCNSSSSSAWAPLEKKMGVIPIGTKSMTKEMIDSNLNFKELITLNFVGGEPLYEKLNFYILEQLLEAGNTNCFISVTTNGSVDLNSTNKDLLKKFKNVNFSVSIDGIGSEFEYLRFPLKWNDLLNNLEFFRTITNNVNVSSTTSNMNMLTFHKTQNWFKEQGLKYHYNPVISPVYFRPGALPQKIKEQIVATKSYTKEECDFFFGQPHTSKDDLDFLDCIKVIKEQDRVKGICIKDYMPEFYQLIEEYYSV
jgi:organic radical activating enzyme